MRRRKSRVDSVPDEAVARPEPEDADTVWGEWDERWEGAEAERVVRWLRSKGAGAGGLPLTAPEACADATPADGQEWPSDWSPIYHREVDGPADTSATPEHASEAQGFQSPDPEDLQTEPAALEQQRRQLITAVEERRAELDSLDEQCQQSAEDLASLRAEIAALEVRVGELTARERAAAAAAEQAQAAERHARARLEASAEEARSREAQQFELWAALDAEVTALQARLDELRLAADGAGGLSGRAGAEQGAAVAQPAPQSG